MRWKHQLTKNFVAIASTSGFDEFPGIQMAPDIHKKFLDRGFEFDAKKKEYHKKVPIESGFPSWILVKFDGKTYFVSAPKKKDGQLDGDQKFTSTDPYYVLNTIKKFENADFGVIVKTEEEALAVKETSYFNAPREWKKYQPYSPVLNPNNIIPAPWVDQELGAYGFKLIGSSKMYSYGPANASAASKALLWEHIRFDKNGTIVYFYPGEGEKGPRYLCTKEFHEVQQKIEVVHTLYVHGQVSPSSSSTPMPWSGFDYANWASEQGHAPNSTISLVPEDEVTMTKLGFHLKQNDDGVIYYSKGSEAVNFFVNGAAAHLKDGKSKHYSSIKSLMEKLWGENMPVNPPSQNPEPKSLNVQKELKDLGFVFKAIDEYGNSTYIRKGPPGNVYTAIYSMKNHTIEFFWLEKLKGKGAEIAEHWTLPFADAIKKLQAGFFAQPKKKKKVLAGTEDMPWSGTDYKKLWAMPPEHPGGEGFTLQYDDDQLMKKMGWTVHDFGALQPEASTLYKGYYYKHGNEAMAFYKGKTVYWSNFGMPSTQSWDTDPEMPIRWLYKNWKEHGGKVPYSGTDYATLFNVQWPSIPKNHSMKLTVQDEKLMKQLGFYRQKVTVPDPAFKIRYIHSNDKDIMYFFASGKAAYWKDDTDGPYYYETVEDALQMLWDKYGKPQQSPTPKTSNAYRIIPADEVVSSLQKYGYKWHDLSVQFVNKKDPLDTIIFMSTGEIYRYVEQKEFKYENVQALFKDL